MSEYQRPRIKGTPKPWTEQEELKLLSILRRGGISYPEISRQFSNRSLVSIRNKIRRLRIKHDLFGNQYREEKIEFTRRIAAAVQPKVVFEAYAGAGHQTLEWANTADRVYSVDNSETKIRQLRQRLGGAGYESVHRTPQNSSVFSNGSTEVIVTLSDAVEAAARLVGGGEKIDLIDLDTCGSTLPTTPTFLALLNPMHLVITHGEFHSLRFGRTDVLRRLLSHRGLGEKSLPENNAELAEELDIALKVSALRARNESHRSFWLKLEDEAWLGPRNTGMLRRHYEVRRPVANADALNWLIKNAP